MKKKKINIAELLKECPTGMELDCASYDNVSFDKISDDKKATYPIFCYITDKEGNRSGISFTENGCESKRYGAKCVIFPKGKTTWEGFQRPFKDGDIVYYNDTIAIFKEWGDETLFRTYVTKYLCCDFFIDTNVPLFGKSVRKEIRFATEEEKEKLFKAIEDNGFKWNAETKTLEKLIEPKFKVGDKVTDKNKFIYRITEITDKGYKLHDLKTTFITFEEADLYFVKVVDIFDITTLKPFDRVLVRLTNNCVWMPKFFSHYDTGPKVKYYPFVTIDNISYPQCIPYNGNEHLCRKTYDCDEFYKTWE